MTIGTRITKLRTEMNLSQGQLAELLGVSRQAVSKWENDQSSPDTLKLIRLADVLNTEVEYLATGKVTKQEPAPIVVNLVKQEERIVEKVVEKVVNKPVVKKIYRTKFVRNPFEYILIALAAFLVGIAVGILIV